MRRSFALKTAIGMTVALYPVWAAGQCPTLDFEDDDPLTVITDQYPGLTCAAPGPGACTGDAILRDMAVYGGTSSGSQALSTQAGPGCEFSPEHLRLLFDHGQAEVSFTVGPGCGTYDITARDEQGQIRDQVQLQIDDCMAWHGVYRLVHLTDGQALIHVVDIDAGTAVSESIDDLQFDQDDTPPLVEIEEPSSRSCVCNPVEVIGTVGDPDGIYVGDVLEYKQEGDADWQFVNAAFGPFSGTLYTWDTDMLSGWTYLRVTGRNLCNLTASETRLVYLDRTPPGITLRSPTDESVVGQTVCFDGSVGESVGTVGGCLSHYHVFYMVEENPIPVDPAHPVYTSPVYNDPFAFWPTLNGIPDGEFEILIEAFDKCDQRSAVTVPLVVDNTAPEVAITSPGDCQPVNGIVPVRGFVADAHLHSWVLDFTGDGIHGWVPIASGSGLRGLDEVLGEWDTTQLPPCAYTLRLRAWDSAILNCDGDDHNWSSFMVSVEVVGDEGGACCRGAACEDVSDPEDCVPFVCDVTNNMLAECGGPCATMCFGDVNGDGAVAASDRGFISANIGETSAPILCQYDMNGDGVITPSDRGFVSANIGLCTVLPDYQNGSGLNGGVADPRFGPVVFMGPGPSCQSVICE